MTHEDLHAWWAAGERVEIGLREGVRHRIFVRTLGRGPWLTLIHGFPTSSWDWAWVAPALAASHRLLAFDLLGFGNSDKPRGHNWNSFEQADIVERLWRRFGVDVTRVLAHDVGVTVSLELVARQDEGKLSRHLADCTFLNAAVYARLYRPRPIQVILQKPLLGALVARLIGERQFGTAFAEVFSDAHRPSAAELHQHWEALSRGNGARNYHRLIRYVAERRVNAGRWEGTLERTTTPIRFVWGMADPVSGSHMAAAIRERRPRADVSQLADVGHYPQLEDPDAVVAAVLRPG